MFLKSKLQNVFSFVAVGLMLFFLVLGCGGMSKECTGELIYEGKTYRGMSKDIEQARKNTCSKYCIEGDPQYDAMYRIWLESPAGKKMKNPSKWDAMAEDKRLYEYVDKCTEKCLQDYRDGKRKIEVNCQ